MRGRGGFSYGAVELVARALAVELASAVEAEVATSAVGVGGGASTAVGLAEEGAAAALTSEAVLAAAPDLTDVEAVRVLGDEEGANKCFEPMRNRGASEEGKSVSESIGGSSQLLQKVHLGRDDPRACRKGPRHEVGDTDIFCVPK